MSSSSGSISSFLGSKWATIAAVAAIAGGAVAIPVVAGGGQPANTLYVRDGGTGNGSDWANACDDFAGSCAVSSLARGKTIYVAAGTYAYRDWSGLPSPSGTTLITVKGATAADHGGSSGWSSSYSVGESGRQAHWTRGTQTGSGEQGYWQTTGVSYATFDGGIACSRTGGAACSDPATYGFVFDGATCTTTDQNAIKILGGTNTNLTFAHIAHDFCNGSSAADVGRCFICDDWGGAHITNIAYNYTYCGHGEVCWDMRSGGLSLSDITQGATVDHGYATNGFSTDSHHGEYVNAADEVSDLVVRFTVMNGCKGTACIASNNSGGVTDRDCVNSGEIYGNTFSNSLPYPNGAQNGVIGGLDTGNCGFSATKIYNNTFYNTNTAALGTNTHGQAGGNTFQNNIICGGDATIDNATHDYNTFGCSATNVPSETHSQTGISDPFVSSSTLDFHLSTDTSAWDSTGQPSGNAVDPDGVTRTSSRGAYQF